MACGAYGVAFTNLFKNRVVMKPKWYHATVKFAGLCSILPGDQVYVRKDGKRRVLIVAMEKDPPCRELFYDNVSRACMELGAAVEHQQMVTRKYKQLWGQG